MKSIHTFALAAIVGLSGGCVPVAVGVGATLHDKQASCACPECSASWSGDHGTVPEHQPDFDGSRGKRCPGGGKPCK